MVDQTLSESANVGLVRKARNAVRARKTTKIETENQREPDGFTFDEREELLRQLSIITDRGGTNIWTWSREIESILRRHRSLVPLAKLLPKRRDNTARGRSGEQERSSREDVLESDIREVLAAAQRIVEAQPVTALGYALRSRIREAVTQDVWSSTPVRAARWVAPALIVLLFGGTLYYSIKFEGLVNLAQQIADKAVSAIKNDTAEVHQSAAVINQDVQEVQRQYQQANTTLSKTQTFLTEATSGVTPTLGTPA
jgi:hypothetical protein